MQSFFLGLVVYSFALIPPVIVLLFLLHASFGGDMRYTWDGPVHTRLQADPDISAGERLLIVNV